MSTRLLTGLALALASTIALDLAFLLQQHAASRAPALSLRAPLQAARNLLRAPRWVFGFTLGLGGWALYLAALTLAPLSQVQTVAAGGIGLLVVLQAAMVRRLPVGRERAGALVATAGLAALALSLGGTSGAGGGTSLTVFGLVCLGALPIIVWAVRGGAAANGLAAGLCYGLGDIATKALLAHLPVHPGLAALIAAPFLYLTLAAHGAGFLLLQRAFQRGPAVASIGTMTAATNLLPIAAGVLLLGDPLPQSTVAQILRATAFICAVAGAWILATGRAVHDGTGDRPPPPHASSPERTRPCTQPSTPSPSR